MKTLSSTYLYEEAEARLHELHQARKQLEDTLISAPAGKIHIAKRKGGIQYYLRKNQTDSCGKYIPKRYTNKISVYLQKAYNEKVLSLVKKEIASIESFLHKSSHSNIDIQKIYSDEPLEIKERITPIDLSDEDFVQKWLSIPFIPKYIEHTADGLTSDKGEVVRSKSELNIANTLFKLNIPYKYECPLLLSNGVTIYPDFTLLNVKERRIIYWEHRGMMDDRDYAKHSVSRIKELRKENIILGKNLIITEETSGSILGTQEIIDVIHAYF